MSDFRSKNLTSIVANQPVANSSKEIVLSLDIASASPSSSSIFRASIKLLFSTLIFYPIIFPYFTLTGADDGNFVIYGCRKYNAFVQIGEKGEVVN